MTLPTLPKAASSDLILGAWSWSGWEHLHHGNRQTIQTSPLLLFLFFFKLLKNCSLNIYQPLSGQNQDSNTSLSPPQAHPLSSSSPGENELSLSLSLTKHHLPIVSGSSGNREAWEKAEHWLPWSLMPPPRPPRRCPDAAISSKHSEHLSPFPCLC